MSDFFYGVIEGFYGRQWSWQDRTEYAGFLSARGFNCYIYAPKGDPFLRGKWQQPFPGHLHDELCQLAASYHEAGLRFGVGLSPQGLFDSYSPSARNSLRMKVEEINAIGADITCILFDDMAGNFNGLAQRQLEIVNDVLAVSQAGYHAVCPTYYSFDPVLEKVFGPMPDNYLSDLARGLPHPVDLFWTGDKVISDEYTERSIKRISDITGRQPLQWDNYPVNDGRITSSYLHLRPYQGRPAMLKDWVRGHCVNPMNQPQLSKLVLSGLADIYGGQGSTNAKETFTALCASTELQALIASDIDRFQDGGRLSLGQQELQATVGRYEQFSADVAAEIVGWLKGEYQFDPACLTE